MTLTHDNNGPFVTFARGSEAREEGPRTETVFAIEVVSAKKGVQYWNPQARPFTDDEVRTARNSAYQFSRSLGYGQILSVTPVSTNVSISRTPWTSLESGE